VLNGPVLEQPTPGRITVGTDGPQLTVRTFDVDGAPRDQPFNVIVVCAYRQSALDRQRIASPHERRGIRDQACVIRR
jgi:hypothetical protein